MRGPIKRVSGILSLSQSLGRICEGGCDLGGGRVVSAADEGIVQTFRVPGEELIDFVHHDEADIFRRRGVQGRRGEAGELLEATIRRHHGEVLEGCLEDIFPEELLWEELQK